MQKGGRKVGDTCFLTQALHEGLWNSKMVPKLHCSKWEMKLLTHAMQLM